MILKKKHLAFSSSLLIIMEFLVHYLVFSGGIQNFLCMKRIRQIQMFERESCREENDIVSEDV